MSREVVISGMGLISSLGLSLEENWKNICDGKSGVKRITRFDPSNCATQIAAQVPPEFEELSKTWIRKRAASQMTRVTRMCVTAAKIAVADSGIKFDSIDKNRCSVIMGVVNTGNSSVERDTTLQNTVFKSMTNSMSAWISLEYQLTGPNFSVNTACASSAYAIAFGYDMIRNGQADVVIVGGADSIINPEEIRGFNALYALSVANDPPEAASRPFSKDRDGFVIGEGAGVLVLEAKNSAVHRQAHIYAQIAGYALTSEGYNIMAPMADGEGMARTMLLALENAGISSEEVDYINAHGTSTELNDRYETMAIKSAFKERAYQIPVSSLKSMLGHTIGAAGAIETIITVLAIENGIIPPTINYVTPDPDLDLDYVPNIARRKEVRVALSNSFGFGGHNATIVIKK
ncbi:MAG: beta-ketoacyl-[acyl-carrier-protein] synthase family protein [Bacteroidales bacterium]|jgi:3-oxoacyl-[acyl-carrier-protein] synthase II|nr:beta-ketoacyl-[acyl-carrier-protein] synthase family protein [Bacteroidales bacterium]